MPSRWPKDNQADLIAFYGTPGTPGLESQLVDVVPPFRMTYEGKSIKAIRFHKKAAPALLAALTEIWEHYGKDQAKLDALGVSRYDGAYNPRLIRGSATRWSNHGFAAAIDINAKDNGFNTGHGTMPKPVVDAFKRQGARWGGDYHGRTDPMHFEFVDGGQAVLPALPPATAPQPAAQTAAIPPAGAPPQAPPPAPATSTPAGAPDAPAAAPPLIAGLSRATVAKIVQRATESSLMGHYWAGRGIAPRGYTKGMAVAFGVAYRMLQRGDPAAAVMAAASVGNSAIDALAWYEGQFHALGMSNAVAGVNTLRHLFDLQIALGMRESSGQYNEGRDTSAENTTAETAEAGMFQQSWNFRSGSPEIVRLFEIESAKKQDDEQSLLTIFREGVHDRHFPDYGLGAGARFQYLCKTRPLFAVLTAAVGLRTIGGDATHKGHWGPINNHAAEIRPEADALFRQVQAVIDAEPVA